MKRNILAMVLIGATSLAYADAPVVDYSAMSITKADSAASSSTSGLSADQRIGKLEQQVLNINQQELNNKIEELQQRVQKLTGQLEDQDHQIAQLKDQLHNFYQDLNQRIEKSATGKTDKPKDSDVTAAEPKILSEGAVVPAAGAANAVTATTAVTPPVPSPSSAPDAKKTDAPQAAPTQHDLDSAFLKEQQMYQTAIDLLPSEKSAQKLRDYLSAYPKGVYVANSHYWLGEINYLQKNYDAAGIEFKTVIDKYPTSKKVSDAYFKLALVHDKQGKHEQAKDEFKRVVKRYPGTTAAQLAKQQLENN